MVEYKQVLKIKGSGIEALYLSDNKYQITTDKFRNADNKEKIPFVVEYDPENDLWLHTDDGVFKKGVTVNFLLSENLDEIKLHFDSEVAKNNYL